MVYFQLKIMEIEIVIFFKCEKTKHGFIVCKIKDTATGQGTVCLKQLQSHFFFLCIVCLIVVL